MGYRDSLRELQTRLAERLQAARSDQGVQAAWLAVQAGGSNYLFPLTQSGQIFPFTAPRPVPYTRHWFLGVANLRGGLWGVIDLASFVRDEPPRQRPDSHRAQARLVALGAVLEINCALLVDRLAGLRGLDVFVASAPAPAGSPAYFGSLYTDPQGDSWQEINLQDLSQQPQFLSISA